MNKYRNILYYVNEAQNLLNKHSLWLKLGIKDFLSTGIKYRHYLIYMQNIYYLYPHDIFLIPSLPNWVL